MDNATVDHGRVHAATVQQGGNHRGGCGFTVGARHRHVAFKPHQLGEHFSAAHHRQALGAGSIQLSITFLDRRGNHDHLGVLKVFCLLANKYFSALFG